MFLLEKSLGFLVWGWRQDSASFSVIGLLWELNPEQMWHSNLRSLRYGVMFAPYGHVEVDCVWGTVISPLLQEECSINESWTEARRLTFPLLSPEAIPGTESHWLPENSCYSQCCSRALHLIQDFFRTWLHKSGSQCPCFWSVRQLLK